MSHSRKRQTPSTKQVGQDALPEKHSSRPVIRVAASRRIQRPTIGRGHPGQILADMFNGGEGHHKVIAMPDTETHHSVLGAVLFYKVILLTVELVRMIEPR